MKTKMKGKGKAIIGIAMAAIMLASVFAAMVPMGMARDNQGGIVGGDTLFCGETGLSLNSTVAVAGDTVRLEGQDNGAEGETISIDPTDFYISENAEEGVYDIYVNDDITSSTLTIKEPEITGNVYLKESTDSIVDESIPIGQLIKIRASPNFGGFLKDAITGNYGNIKIKLYDPDGLQVETVRADGNVIDLTQRLANKTRIDLDNIETTYPDDWSTGTWKVKISSDKGTCNEVDISSDEYEFTIRSEDLVIEATEDEVGKGEDILLRISGNPSRTYYFAIENVKADKEPVILDRGDIKDSKIGPGEGTNCSAWIKTGTDGVAEIKIGTSDADERTYTMHVYDNPMKTDGTSFAETDYPKPDEVKDEDDEADTDVEVTEAEVTFDMPNKVVIGEEVDIKGSVNAGDKIDILIDDEYDENVKDDGDNIDIDENNEFEAKWKTEGYMTGSYTIKVYIDYKKDKDVDPDTDDDDGSITIRLIEQGVTAEQPRNVIAEKDDYQITGTATGVEDVDYVLIGPKGSRTGDVDDITGGLLIDSTSVKDDEFDEDDITMTDGLDTGQWVALVLSPGRDAGYGDYGEDYGAGNLVDLFDVDGPVSLKGKDQSQIIAIIEDNTLGRAGSDDKIVAFSFKVESGYVDLNPVEAVGIGDPLNVSGTTNREPETSITISTFSKPAGAIDLPAVITEVEWETADEGTFTATIDTEDAVEGTYTLEADDGDGNTDTITVVIGEAAPEPTPTAEPTAEPTAAPTAIPTAAPTAEPTAEPTATPEPPGFEAVFAIAGMLSIAYLVLRKRRE